MENYRPSKRKIKNANICVKKKAMFSLKQVDCDSNISFLNTMVSNTPGSSYSVKHTQNVVKTFGRNNSDIGCKPTGHVRRKDDADKSRCLKIVDLPSKIMERILRYLPFDNIAKLRLVSKYFNKVCSMMLSSEFFRLRAFMFHRLQTIKAQMPRRESARRKHPLARENEIIEALHARLSLLHMTFGNHIEKNHCCFFPGEIIDEVYRILKFIRNTSNLNEVYNITDELFDLSTMAMEYFKEHIEPALPEIKYFVTDLIECPSVNILSRTSSAKALIAKSSACEVPVHQKSNSFSTLKEHVISTYKLAKRNREDVLSVKRSLKSTREKIVVLQKELQRIKQYRRTSQKSLVPNVYKFNEVLLEMRRYKLQLQMLASNLSSDDTSLKAGFKCMPLVSSTSTHCFRRPSTVQRKFVKFSDLCKKSSFMYNEYDDMEVITCEVSSLKKNSVACTSK